MESLESLEFKGYSEFKSYSELEPDLGTRGFETRRLLVTEQVA